MLLTVLSFVALTGSQLFRFVKNTCTCMAYFALQSHGPFLLQQRLEHAIASHGSMIL